MGNKAIAEALLELSEEAQLSVDEGVPMLETGIMVSPMYLTTFLVGRALMHLGLLKKKLECEFGSDILQLRTAAYRSTKEAVQVSKRYAPFRTWILRLMGDYYWLVGRQRKAMKWYGKSIKEVSGSGQGRICLARTWKWGKAPARTAQQIQRTGRLNAKAYLEKAEIIVPRNGLENDLDELELLRLQM